MHRIRLVVLSSFLTFVVLSSVAQEDLKVLSGQRSWMQHADASNALYHHFAGEAFGILAKRNAAIAGFQSLEDWQNRQQWTKKTLNEIVGTFPAKTPLNARVVRVVDKDFFRIEHVIFESQPGFYVTSSLFVPKSRKRNQKLPAVIYCSGHAAEGYRSETYLHIILNLVKKGFIVFAFDPVGQGERLEYFDSEKQKSAVGGPTTEHSYPGTQAFISGSSQAQYMIWDGIRAVDFLLTRKEVDPSRIGITGRSGGGTQSSYIAAFDERIAAVAPECYITSFTRLLQSIGPQDAEQNFFNGIARGIDHGDLLIVRAPKPALMITTTHDFFSIQGARETAASVARVYDAYGKKSSFQMVEDDAGHASTKKNREAMYAFFQQHLVNPGDPTDEEMPPLIKDDVRVTNTGQLGTSLKSETVFSLNLKALSSPAYASDKSTIVEAAKKLSGYRAPASYDGTESAVFTGRLQRDDYAIEKYFVKGEGDYVIPFLVMVPKKDNGKSVLYLHPAGKEAEAASGGEIEEFVKKGFRVIAPDLPGVGELGAGKFKGDAFIGGISHNIWYSAMLIGRSITGVQAADIARVISADQAIKASEVYAIAKKELTPVLLHAAAFHPVIKKIALIEPLTSFHSLVSNRFYYSPFITAAVPGMLREYDLPALAASLAPRDLSILNPLDGAAERISEEEKETYVKMLKGMYSGSEVHGAEPQIMETPTDREAISKVIERWAVK